MAPDPRETSRTPPQTQPDTAQSGQAPSHPEPRSFEGKHAGGGGLGDREIDTFSTNEREGRPGPQLKPDPEAIAAGEEDGYATDTFSRNDVEGSPGVELAAGDDSSVSEAEPDEGLRAVTDDPASRDAPPPSAGGGGVR